MSAWPRSLNYYNMQYFNPQSSTRTLIGLANGPGVLRYLRQGVEPIDYVEVPFEQLRHDPTVVSLQNEIPIILHCASLSMAGFVTPEDDTIDAIWNEATRARTPWIGEHLAFMSADPVESADDHSELTSAHRLSYGAPRSNTPTLLNYTVCPQLSEDTLDRVVGNLTRMQARFPMPLILENPPQYFHIPGSTIPLVDFIIEFFRRTRIGVLLDLTHFAVSALNMRFDPLAEIHRMPLEQVVEVHISGYNTQSGVAWDDHGVPAPPRVFELLSEVLQRSRPRAVTFEYNWEPHFPDEVLTRQIAYVREMLARC